ncbi:hypothetical protein [Anabaena sp. UHCC 0204]|uniref:hypothetical protein n=1 Tax=Anabaena sp. UHCC 0204 TaxID=2590009 RepID=UPI001445F816|nr:hypothetical protein [Anabaena sp. UHCC 0204]MTJ10282.1 hypothetical protein [Anabaena sp. UHCC 0204]
MSILEFLIAINGNAQLWSADNVCLGLLSSNQHDPNSINNLHGIYGGYHGNYSIRNSHSLYGGQHGTHSPYNIYCPNPPFVLYQGQPVLVITRNAYFQTNGVPVIDPDFLLGVYAQLAASPQMLHHSTPMDRINESARNTMESITHAGAIVASMFH